MFSVRILAQSGWIYTYEYSSTECNGEKKQAESFAKRDHFLRVFFNELDENQAEKSVLEVSQKS